MPQPNTTQVAAPIDTTALSDTYATHKSWRGQGGWSEVSDLTARDAITTERRHQGMSVWVVSENKAYILQNGVTNADWVEFSGGGGGGISGTLTNTYIPVATGTSTIGDSFITQDTGGGSVNVGATLTANNLSGTNTGDQDLTDYTTISLTGTKYKNNQGLFLTNTSIKTVTTNNTVPTYEQTLVPPVGGLTFHTATTSATLGEYKLFGLYRMTDALNKIYIRQGIWTDTTRCYVSDTAANGTIYKRIMVSSGVSGIDTVSIDGTGTVRTATIVGGDLTFVPTDYNASLVSTSYIETPTGVFAIVAYNSSVSVNVSVPSTYVNEAHQDLIIHRNTFGINVANITNTSTKTKITFSGIQSALALLQSQFLSVLMFVRSTVVPSVTFSIVIGGSSSFTYMETPEIVPRLSRFYPADINSVYSGYPGQIINSSTPFYISFGIPTEADYIENVFLILITPTGTGGVDIDLTTIYSVNVNAVINEYTASDTTTTYIFFTNKFLAIPIKNLLTNAQPGTRGNVELVLNTAALTFYVLGVEVFYR